MNDGARQIVGELRAHIEHEMRDRDAAGPLPYVASREQRKERDRLMERLLTALGISRSEIQSRLGIGRATWDRWRAMTSIPRRTYLEMLERLATDEGSASVPARTLSRHDMLNATPRTWARLRLVLSAYDDWEDAVFLYRSPYKDYSTVTEMLLLAARGCRIVYIMTNAGQWAEEFTRRMIDVIGKVDAARALSKFCIINVQEKEAEQLRIFILNFTTDNPRDLRVGYIWTGEDERPEEATADQYVALPWYDQHIVDVEARYSKIIGDALELIDQRHVENIWGHAIAYPEMQALLKIPIIEFRPEGGKPHT